jgi:membrane fusion protein (multidrug efflux system)
VGAGALSLRHRRLPPELPDRNGGAAVIATPEVSLNGTIRPQHIAGVGSQIEGNIEAFMANVGDEVFQGQVLARIGAAGLESEREAAAHTVEYAQDQVSKAEAAINASRMEASRAAADEARARMALDRAQKVYARQKTLHAAGATPRLTFEKAEQDYEAAQQEHEIMDKGAQAANGNVQSAIEALTAAKKVLAEKSQQLEDAQGAFEAAEVRSPVEGLIVGRKGDLGAPVQESGDQLFQIATDVYALEVAVEPKPEVLKRLRPGQPALVVVLDLQTGGMPGTLKEIKGTQAVVEFTSTMPAIRPGMRADVRLKVE